MRTLCATQPVQILPLEGVRLFRRALNRPSVQNCETAVGTREDRNKAPNWNAIGPVFLISRLAVAVEDLPGQRAASIPGHALGPDEDRLAAF